MDPRGEDAPRCRSLFSGRPIGPHVLGRWVGCQRQWPRLALKGPSRARPIDAATMTGHRSRMTLAAVLAQPRALKALRSALAAQAVHHAYLFAGPEGVGKEMT